MDSHVVRLLLMLLICVHDLCGHTSVAFASTAASEGEDLQQKPLVMIIIDQGSVGSSYLVQKLAAQPFTYWLPAEPLSCLHSYRNKTTADALLKTLLVRDNSSYEEVSRVIYENYFQCAGPSELDELPDIEDSMARLKDKKVNYVSGIAHCLLDSCATLYCSHSQQVTFLLTGCR